LLGSAALRLLTAAAMIVVCAALARVVPPHAAGGAHRAGRIFVLMVWDGLRPDLVTQRDTPNAFAFQNEGVRFNNHHSLFPTVTMVNAATLATGEPPGGSGIFEDMMYFLPLLGKTLSSDPFLGHEINGPINIERSPALIALNSPRGFDGRLLGLESVAQQVERTGGFIATVGKTGPTFMFDDRVSDKDPQSGTPPVLNNVFVSDDMAQPAAILSQVSPRAGMRHSDFSSVGQRDTWFTNLVISKALPAAKAASNEGKPSLIVLWQHNPDTMQHMAGLGTQPALDALATDDANLGRLRAAVSSSGIGDRTDLMIVSDHGFATIKEYVPLSDLLIGAGIKKASDAAGIVVAGNGGSDLVYLSREEFPTEAARRAILERIVAFAEGQEWCGPIFSRDRGPSVETTGDKHLGRIPGTFSQAAFGLYNPQRSPDLIISLRELSNIDNRGLTGPANPAIALSAQGPQPVKNNSSALVRPIEGVMYSDVAKFTTGMGMHGAAGRRELHNFCAAVGPDFHHRFVDFVPTGNADIAPTIRAVLDEAADRGSSGRVMSEALVGKKPYRGSATLADVSTHLAVNGMETVTMLKVSRYAGREYLDDSSVTRAPVKLKQ
jgi:Type I phosphodiesterase / nucleotide pyrophosphatase